MIKRVRGSISQIKLNLLASDFEWVDSGPPDIEGDETCSELGLLHEMVALRPAKQAEIECEVNLSCFRLGGFTLAEGGSRVKYPLTYQLLMREIEVIDPTVMSIKQKYDRARPNQADPTLTTAIPVPDFAAYPSRHSTQAMLMALTLGELNPSRRLAYLEDGIRIGRNREIAGVHYPSDTEAGGRLAADFFAFLRGEPWFREAFESARAEWQRDEDTLVAATH